MRACGSGQKKKKTKNTHKAIFHGIVPGFSRDSPGIVPAVS